MGRDVPVGCVCGSGSRYARCCKPLHRGEPAPTPERLMRSRYAAYAMGKVGYIMRTTHRASPLRKPEAEWMSELRTFSDAAQFCGLEVVSAVGDEVHFVAHLEVGGVAHAMEERSRFALDEGRWAYVEPKP